MERRGTAHDCTQVCMYRVLSGLKVSFFLGGGGEQGGPRGLGVGGGGGCAPSHGQL